MSSQIGHASNCIALYFDVGTEHLPDQRLQTTELYYKEFVLGCYHGRLETVSDVAECDVLLTARFPRAALAARWTSVSWLLRR